MTERRLRLGVLATHPIQYYVPWYRALSELMDVEVFFSHHQTADGQARAGFAKAFEWDVPLFEGYRHTMLRNVSRHADVNTFFGCDTPEIGALIRQRQFDAFVVHGWSTRSYWQAMRACWVTRTPLLVRGDSHLGTPRAWWWRAIKTPLFRAFIPRFDGYLVVGARARDYLLRYGATPERCFSSPHCVDNAFFRDAVRGLGSTRPALRGRFGLESSAVVFLLAGRLVSVKRVNLFIDAIARAARQYPGVQGLVVGDGPLREALVAQAETFGAPVRFAGFLNQTQMPEAYAAADCVVLASTSETWGLVVNEGMAAGLPAIVSDTTGCAGELVLPGVTGEVFPSGDVARLADTMLALAQAPDYRARLGGAAEAHVAQFDVTAAASGALRAVQALRSRAGADAPQIDVPQH